MRYYRVTVQANGVAPPLKESHNSLLWMQLVFTVGDKAMRTETIGESSIPIRATVDDVIHGVLIELKIAEFMQVMDIEEIKKEDTDEYTRIYRG